MVASYDFAGFGQEARSVGRTSVVTRSERTSHHRPKMFSSTRVHHLVLAVWRQELILQPETSLLAAHHTINSFDRPWRERRATTEDTERHRATKRLSAPCSPRSPCSLWFNLASNSDDRDQRSDRLNRNDDRPALCRRSFAVVKEPRQCVMPFTPLAESTHSENTQHRRRSSDRPQATATRSSTAHITHDDSTAHLFASQNVGDHRGAERDDSPLTKDATRGLRVHRLVLAVRRHGT